jgi:hypothetical protein
MITGSGALAAELKQATMRRAGWRSGLGKIFLPRSAFARGVGRERRNEIWASGGEGSGRRVSAVAEWLPTMAGRDGVLGRGVRSGLRRHRSRVARWAAALGVRHFEQAEFEMEALFLFVAELAVSAQHDLQVAREVFFAEQFGDAIDALAFFARNLQQGRILPGNLGDGGVAQETHHLAGEVCGAVTFADEVVDLAKNFVARAAETACMTSSRI